MIGCSALICDLLYTILRSRENLCLILYQVVAWLLHGKSFYKDCFKILPIMLALCLMLSETYYAQNYAGMIGLDIVKYVCIYYFMYMLIKI